MPQRLKRTLLVSNDFEPKSKSHFAAEKTCQGYVTGVTEIVFEGHVIIFLMNTDIRDLPRIEISLTYYFN